MRLSASRILLFALVVLGSSLGARAATVAANSCSRTDVGIAVTSAGRNGTVNVPSGNCAWSSVLTITFGITLTGAGVGNTVLTTSGGVRLFNIFPDATAVANGENIKITGFTFDGGNSSATLISIQGASGITGTKPYRFLIIGDNKFQNMTTSSSNAAIQADPNDNGQISGVIYNNIFDRCNIILRIFSNNDTREWANTAFNRFSFGSSDNLYFEDNTIMFSSSYDGDNPGWIESGQGGRVVGRYNTWNQANATRPQEVWDIHGFQGWTGSPNSGQTSTMIVEYYGNTLSNMRTFRWINHRGSWGLFFNNILTGSGANDIDLYGVNGSSCSSDINPTPTNYNPLVNNSYFFNNTKAGINVTATLNVPPASCTVSENTNWWNYNPSCTSSSCSAGIGRGTTAPTGTCTTGVGYWVASTATPTADPAVIQAGTFYKCTSTNTWTAYYKPYTYPHPLRSPSSGAPAPPTNMRVVP